MPTVRPRATKKIGRSRSAAVSTPAPIAPPLPPTPPALPVLQLVSVPHAVSSFHLLLAVFTLSLAASFVYFAPGVPTGSGQVAGFRLAAVTVDPLEPATTLSAASSPAASLYEAEAAPLQTCTDGDGENTSVAGSATVYDLSTNGVTDMPDVCDSDFAVREATCAGTSSTYKVISCGVGQFCKSGACVAVPGSCLK